MKQQNLYKGHLPWQDEFDQRFACWANNHNGWAKMKKFNKRLAKRKSKQQLKKDMKNMEDD